MASVLPLTLVTNAVRVPWLGLGQATGTLAEVIACQRRPPSWRPGAPRSDGRPW